MGKWDNGIRVGISEKMKVGANDSVTTQHPS